MPVKFRKPANAVVSPRKIVAPIKSGPARKPVSPTVGAWVPDPTQRLLSVKATAKYLGTSTWEIRRLLRQEAFSKIQIGKAFKVDRADLDVFIEKLKAA